MSDFITGKETPSEYDRGKAAAYEELRRKIQLAIEQAIEEGNQDGE